MTGERLERDRALRRLWDIRKNVQAIRRHLAGKTLESVANDELTCAAFVRFLEMISEASRHLPNDWKATHPEIPWRRMADLGNRLRHEYHDVQLEPLWEIYLKDLDPLERAVDAMLAAHPPMENPT